VAASTGAFCFLLCAAACLALCDVQQGSDLSETLVLGVCMAPLRKTQKPGTAVSGCQELFLLACAPL
jgi:hypothetical protein